MTQLTPSQYEAEIAALKAEVIRLLREVEELKQWVSDACELLHELDPADLFPVHGDAMGQRIADLLRRIENP